MRILKAKITKILKDKDLSAYKLSKIIDYPESPLGRMINGKISFSDPVKEKLLPILDISKEEFESWIIADKYPKEFIEKALNSFKTRKDKESSVLSQNINALLKEKGLSQTAFGKIIKHSQSSLSCVITGKEPMSKKLMQKISTGLEIPVEYIQIWVLADKYTPQVLESALKNYTP
jgi:predicted transcriptional regulator